MQCGTVLFSKKRMLLSEQNTYLNRNFASLASLAIIVSGNVLELKKFPKPECDSTHNVLLNGAKKIFARKENSNVSNKVGKNKSKENTNTSTHADVSDVHDIESFKELLPIATLGVSSEVTSLLTLVLCDSAPTPSWVSSSLVNRLVLVS